MAVTADGLTTSPRSSSDEASIGVTIEDQREVRAAIAHGLRRIDQVLRLQRIGWVVGKAAVWVGVETDQLQIAASQHRRQGVPGHAVARVDHDRSRRMPTGRPESADGPRTPAAGPARSASPAVPRAERTA